MINQEKYTDRELENIASILSGEQTGDPGLISRFIKDDLHKTGDIWKELKEMNSSNDINVDNAWKKVEMKISAREKQTGKGHHISLSDISLRIAAIGLILLTIGTAAFYAVKSGSFSREISFSTDNDEKNLLIQLPDGSRIFLNRSSELTYLKSYGKNDRCVRLTGEAFFEISPDTNMPFTIDAGNATVKVVGTSFNVITSNKDSEVEVFVRTGKVIVSGSENSGTLELDPGYVGKIDSHKAEKNLNSDPNYLSWNTGLLVYNGQTLDIVFKDLKRVYNMEIVTDDKTILENRWTSPIDNQSQETIIRLICISFNLGFTRDGNIYHLERK